MTLVVIIGFLMGVGLAGCCGGTPSHYCQFTPEDGGAKDSGPGGCFGQTCVPPQVCCVRFNAPPYASCVDQSKFVEYQCEKRTLQCSGPNDCPGGNVCCVAYDGVNAQLSCATPEACPAKGLMEDGTSILCIPGSTECPSVSQTCGELPGENGASTGIFLCM